MRDTHDCNPSQSRHPPAVERDGRLTIMLDGDDLFLLDLLQFHSAVLELTDLSRGDDLDLHRSYSWRLGVWVVVILPSVVESD